MPLLKKMMKKMGVSKKIPMMKPIGKSLGAVSNSEVKMMKGIGQGIRKAPMQMPLKTKATGFFNPSPFSKTAQSTPAIAPSVKKQQFINSAKGMGMKVQKEGKEIIAYPKKKKFGPVSNGIGVGGN